MPITPYTGNTNIISVLGTTPNERGLSTEQFKAKFDEGLTTFKEWFNNTHVSEIDALAGTGRTTETVKGNADNIATLTTAQSRAEGFHLSPSDWYGNVKEIATCESSEGWANNSWSGAAGTVANDSTSGHFKVGSQGISITTSVNGGGGRLVKDMDLSTLNDGGTLNDSDYIRLWLYITTAEINKMAADSSIRILIPCDVAPTLTNYFVYDISKANLVDGGKVFDILKSSFTAVGAPNWATIKGISSYYRSAGATPPTSVMTWTIDAIHACRKDPQADYPNPFQRNGVRDMIIGSGRWFIGKEFGKIILRNLSPSGGSTSALYSTKRYADFEACGIFIAKQSYGSCYGLAMYDLDTHNTIMAYIYTNSIYLNRSGQTPVTKSCTVLQGDKIVFNLKRYGTLVALEIIKNDDLENPYSLAIDTGVTGLVAVGVYDYSAGLVNVESLSITTTSHAHSSDIAQVAKSMAIPEKAGAFTADELGVHGFGLDTTNNRLYIKKSDGTVKYASLT